MQREQEWRQPGGPSSRRRTFMPPLTGLALGGGGLGATGDGGGLWHHDKRVNTRVAVLTLVDTDAAIQLYVVSGDEPKTTQRQGSATSLCSSVLQDYRTLHGGAPKALTQHWRQR
jgi:hypothetical protein